MRRSGTAQPRLQCQAANTQLCRRLAIAYVGPLQRTVPKHSKHLPLSQNRCFQFSCLLPLEEFDPVFTCTVLEWRDLPSDRRAPIFVPITFLLPVLSPSGFDAFPQRDDKLTSSNP